MDNLYTFIIPTLWKPNIEAIAKLVKKVSAVGRTIIIDNANDEELRKKLTWLVNDRNVEIYVPGHNLFVNGSWNKGVQLSNTLYTVLLNDDLDINTPIKEIVSLHYGHMLYTSSRNVYGLHESTFNHTMAHPIKFHKVNNRSYGWGCMIMFKTDSWVPIPHELKIWCGDDWIVYTAKQRGNDVYSISGLNIRTHMSTTSDLSEFDVIKQRDLDIYRQIDKTFWYKGTHY